MKRAPLCPARLAASLFLGCGLLAGALRAEIVTLIDYQAGAGGADNTTRGFYVTNYPGSSINGVTVWMRTNSAAPNPYQIGLTVTEGAFDGPVVASWFASATLTSTPTPVSIQMVSPPPQHPNPPVAPGSTLCFKFFVNAHAGAPQPFFETIGNLGEDLPDATDPCPNVVQTNDTTPPLSTFRREGVKLQITGNKYLEVQPGYSIQLAIDNADPGDTVTVAPGTYHEDLVLRGDIDVQGAGPGETILVGTGSGDVVTASGIANMEFSGFTIEGSGPGNFDAGFHVGSSNIVVRNNTITGNTLGIRTVNSTSFFCSNLLTGNGNVSNGVRDFAIRCSGNDLFAGNLIVANLEWGVLAHGAGNAPQFVNNTISENAGGGFQAAYAEPVLKNTIVSDNGSIGIFAENNAVVESTYNCIAGNSPATSEVRGGTIVDHTGETHSDPAFDPAQPGLYLLGATSPCVDAGDPAPIYNDIDGSRNDIGATGGLCGSATPPGSIVSGFVWTSVGTIATADIDQGSGPKRGLTHDRDRPFGGSPWLFGAFGADDIPYRYAVKVGKWTGSTPPPAGAFAYVDEPLSKVRYDISGGTLSSSRVSLGPVALAGKPAYTPTRNSGNVIWAHENLRVVLNTLGLDNGTYSVRLEPLNIFGAALPLTVNHDLVMRVNNTRPVVSIDSLSVGGGAPVDECGIIDLASPTSTLDFVYTASHPDGFLDNYSLHVLWGRNRSGGTIASDNYANHVVANAAWTGESLTAVAATPAASPPPLPGLQPWHSCAYQFRITAWARTTNGFGPIYHATFFDNYALDLDPAGPCSPDLDGDGDVDTDDLAIMAAAFGTP